jgi:hypothetical protein
MSRHHFAAIPARALLDRRLDGGRFQLLAAIGLGDHMGQGQGCWKSAATLARLSGLEPGTVRVYLGDLIAWGYVVREERPGTRTHRTLFTIYDDAADLAAAQSAEEQPVNSRVNGLDRSSPVANTQPVNPRINGSGGNPLIGDPKAVNSRVNTKNSKREKQERKTSAEAGCAKNSATDDVDCLSENQDRAFLRRTQAFLKAEGYRPFTESEIGTLRRWRDRCHEIWEATPLGDPVNSWAYGLAEELSGYIQEDDQT